METNTQVAQAAPEVAQVAQDAAPVAETKTAEKPFRVKPEYYAPVALETAAAKVAALQAECQERGVPVLSGIPDEGLLAGFGVGIVPITKQIAQRGIRVLAVVIGQIPDSATIAGYADEKHSKGPDFISGLLKKEMLKKLKGAFKPNDQGRVLGVFPDTLDAFLVSDRGEGLGTYREIGPGFVKVLHQMKMKSMTVQLLRQILESAPFASTIYPGTGQEHWVKLLDRMIGYANKVNLDPQILIHWKNTREETVAQLGEFNDELFDELMD